MFICHTASSRSFIHYALYFHKLVTEFYTKRYKYKLKQFRVIKQTFLIININNDVTCLHYVWTLYTYCVCTLSVTLNKWDLWIRHYPIQAIAPLHSWKRIIHFLRAPFDWFYRESIIERKSSFYKWMNPIKCTRTIEHQIIR